MAGVWSDEFGATRFLKPFLAWYLVNETKRGILFVGGKVTKVKQDPDQRGCI